MKKLILFTIVILFSVVIMAQSVGVGTSTPAASAQLDVNSTSKGFLPPRMTAVQRDSIVNPATGLIVFCTNCDTAGQMQYFSGSSWRNMIGAAAALPPVGHRFRGGALAYVLKPGDPGYDANTPHGLIVAPVDQSSGIQWYNGSFVLTQAFDIAIGTGAANTTKIITVQGAGSYAAQLCADLVLNGYDDWYLPSLDELRTAIGVPGIGLPVMPQAADYWTSSEVFGPTMPQTASALHLPFGDVAEYPKSELLRVRAFRSF